jgi:uncharacterized protein YqeY
MLIDKIKEDIKISLKSGIAERTGVLRLLISELQNKQKEKFGGSPGELSDEDAVVVLQREAKKRREAIELFKKGNRGDLIKKEENELKVIGEYLPQQLTPAEIKAVVEKLKTKGLADFNSIMRETMKELKGRADGKLVGEIVKEVLQ